MKWQYNLLADQNPAQLLAKLNQAGQGGWEAVSFIVQEGAEPDRFIALVKKQVA